MQGKGGGIGNRWEGCGIQELVERPGFAGSSTSAPNNLVSSLTPALRAFLLSALGGYIHPGQRIGLHPVAAQMLGLIQHVVRLLYQGSGVVSRSQ